MNPQARIDISGLRKRVAALRRESPRAARSAVSVAVEHMLDEMIRVSPSDTQRYKRAWQITANQLGFPRPVLPVVQSAKRAQQRSRFVQQLARAREQLDFWTQRVNALQADGRTQWKSYKTAQRYQRRAEKVVERAQEVLAEFDGSIGAIVIGGRRKTSGFYGRAQLAAPRVKVFGGEGRWSIVSNEFRAFGRHLEPHARLVEYGAVKRAKRLGRDGQELSATVKTPAYRVLRHGLNQARRLGARDIKPVALRKLPSRKGAVNGN